MFGLGMGEMIVILAVGLLLFGSQLPRVARSLGSTVATFRREAGQLKEGVGFPTS